MSRKSRLGDSKITLSLPQNVLKQLRFRTVTDETTMRALMLEALAKAGYAVDMEEIRDRRRPSSAFTPSSNRTLT